MKSGLFFVILLVMVAGISPAEAQNFRQQRLDLQQQQQQTRVEIQSLRRQILGFQQEITRTASQYDEAYARYQNLQREITVRDAIISSLRQERRQLAQEVSVVEENIATLRKDLEVLIANYKQTLRYIYKHGRTPDTAILLTAGSINQMLRRSYYLRRFEQHRLQQANQIEEARKELEQQQQELVVLQRRNQANLAETENEQRTLQQRVSEQESLIAVLQSDRKSLEDRLAQTRQEVEQFERLLTEAIAEEERLRRAEEARIRELEAERQRRLAMAENVGEPGDAVAPDVVRPTAPRRTGRLPSEEDLAILERSFGSQKGKLPFPVDNGVISGRFGNRVHPLYGTTTQNLGVDIAAEAGSQVRAVHDGYVFLIRAIPGYGDAVFVNHGRYKTVYANLSEIRVRNEQYLRAGDVIGLSGNENSLRGISLFFMIRDGSVNVDPEQWFARR